LTERGPKTFTTAGCHTAICGLLRENLGKLWNVVGPDDHSIAGRDVGERHVYVGIADVPEDVRGNARAIFDVAVQCERRCDSNRSQIVVRTFNRAKYLSLASISVHGA
jgi:hypothetical protein